MKFDRTTDGDSRNTEAEKTASVPCGKNLPWSKRCLLASGLICAGLGILGLFLPVLPTTPFLLLACYCFLKSSKPLHSWLIGHRILGPYIYNYMAFRTIKLRIKVFAVSMLWVALAASFFAVNLWFVRLLLFVIGIAVTTHIVLLKTCRDENKKN